MQHATRTIVIKTFSRNLLVSAFTFTNYSIFQLLYIFSMIIITITNNLIHNVHVLLLYAVSYPSLHLHLHLYNTFSMNTHFIISKLQFNFCFTITTHKFDFSITIFSLFFFSLFRNPLEEIEAVFRS